MPIDRDRCILFQVQIMRKSRPELFGGSKGFVQVSSEAKLEERVFRA